MNDITEEELVRRLNRLGNVVPTPEATGHALKRVRCALAENPVPVRPARRSVANRWAAIAAMLLVTAGLSGWLVFSPPTGRAWADVQAAMKAVHSVTFRETEQEPGQPDNVSRSWILSNGLCRMEPPNGHYIVADVAKGQILDVDPQHRSATLWRGVSNKPPTNFYELVKNLPGDATARPLPQKKLDGREALGFAVKVEGQEVTVWADARTRLPVRIEIDDKDSEGKKIGEKIIDDLVFDKDLDVRLFSFEPPAGYKFFTIGPTELPAVQIGRAHV
jgi:outer membrane lipoprotein-sorting protein